jgi:type I restriction enzyme S subunit
MKEVKIKDICDKGSSNLKQKDVKGEKGRYPVFGASGVISYINTYHQNNNYIAIVKDGSGIGRVSFMPAQSSVIGTMQYILPKKGFNINYIGYCLQSLDLSRYNQGAAIPHIYFKDYGERVVKVAEDVDEQQRIVDYLDTTFANIDQIKANASNSLNEAKVLFLSALSKAITPKDGWKEITLGDVCSIDSFLVDPRLVEYKSLLHVGGANIISFTGQLVNLQTACQEKLESGKFLFDDKVVLYNKIRPYLVKVARPAFSGLCSADMYPLTPKDNITKDFLYYILTSKDFTRYAIQGSARAGMPKVNRSHLFSYKFRMPILSDQQEIANNLDALSEKVNILQQNCDLIVSECDALKRAILKQIFE